MQSLKSQYQKIKGFTIVEIVVVVAVIGVLATIGVLGYGSWRASVSAAQVKSDLNAVASAMESARTFNNAYPTSIPSTVVPSSGVGITVSSATADSYCIDGTITANTSIQYYVASESKDQGALAGACATRPGLAPPVVPGSFVIVASGGTQVDLSWGVVADATNYTIQCASDAAFITGLQSATVTGLSGSVTGLTPSSSFYCRIKANNNSGSSAWSAYATTSTDDSLGSLAVASSLDGYWTTAPEGYLLEDGSAVSRTTYSYLFAVIGTTYGIGDGSTTFNLPDSSGRAAVNLSPTDTEFDSMGEKPGSKTEALTIAQMPSHNHTQNSHNHTQDAHANVVTDPTHNHTQNSHNHTQDPHNHNGGHSNRYISDGSLGSVNVFTASGAAYGYKYGASPASTATNIATTAVNVAATTGIASVSTDTATNVATTATNQNTGSGTTHNNIQPSIVKTSVIKYAPVDITASSLPVGSSINGYWPTAPTGYVLEDGTSYPVATYPALQAVIGYAYGGSGSNFNVPDSRGRVSVNTSTDTEFDTIGELYGTKTHTLTTAQIPSHTHVQDPHTHTQNTHTHTLATDPGHNHTQNSHNHTQNSHSHNNGFTLQYVVYDGSWGGSSVATLAGGNYGFRAGNMADLTATNIATTATNVAASSGFSLYSTTPTNAATTITNQATGGDGSHNEIQPSIVKRSAMRAAAATAGTETIKPGTSLSGYWSAAPTGYLLEDGSSVSTTTYADLFAAIGYTHGGSGASFNLPDSRGRVGVMINSADTEFDVMGEKPGSKTEALTTAQMPIHTHTQTSHNHTQTAHTHSVYDPGHNHTQASHNHTQNAHTHAGGYVNAGNFGGTAATSANGLSYGFYLATQPNLVATNQATTATNNATTTGMSITSLVATNQSTTAVNQSTGSGGTHNNIQPSITKLFVIKY